MDPKFFIFVALAIVMYGIQIPFLIIYVRRHGALIISLYRNLSYAVTMLPLLLFVPLAQTMEISSHLTTLALASSTGAFAFICNLSASKYLPIGISNSLRQMVYVVLAVIIGSVFLGEYLSLVQLALLAGLIGSVITLMLIRSQHEHLDASKRGLGYTLAICAGVGHSLSFFFFSVLSRELHPIVASFFWEVSIGFFALAYALFLASIGKYTEPVKLPLKSVIYITLISSLTIIATLSYSYAVNYGPYALASGMVTASVLVTAAMGWLIFRERLSWTQGTLIVAGVCMIFLLKFLS